MNKKADVSVIINNKEYIICGYESSDYLEKIASYINRKQGSLKAEPGYATLDRDLRNVLLDVNIADDYFKAIGKIEELEEERTKNREELFDMKHEAVIQKRELEQLQQENKELEEQVKQLKKAYLEQNTQLTLEL